MLDSWNLKELEITEQQFPEKLQQKGVFDKKHAKITQLKG